MATIQIKIDNKTLEMDDQDFYSIINGMNKNIYDSAQRIYEDHRLGLLNSNGSQESKYLWSQDEVSASLLKAIKDKQVRHYFNELKKLARKLRKHDKKIVTWLAGYFGIRSLDTSQNRQKLNQELSRERGKAARNGTGLLSWVNEPEYQKLVQKSFEMANGIQDLVSKLDEQIQNRVSKGPAFKER